MFKFFTKIFYICSVFLLASCSVNDFFVNNDKSVNIRLIEDDTFSIESENPVTIKKGDDAKFKVKIEDGFDFDPISEGSYDIQNNIYAVRNNYRSRNVRLLTKKQGCLSLIVENDNLKGKVLVSPDKAHYDVGDKITIDVSPLNGNRFMCFTKTNPYRPNGNWGASGRPLSFCSSFSFVINCDIKIVTNYFDNNLLIIDYNANGGRTIDGNDVIELDYSIPKQFTKPTSILGTHYLFRDGYTLESFNSKADGSGKRIGIGSAVDIELKQQNKITLYAQWEKWTDYSQFEIRESDDYCSLEKYIGDDSVVVLPNMFNNKPLIHISPFAFQNKRMTSLIINEKMEMIDDFAIVNCENLTDLLIFTSITSITKDFISGNSALHFLKLNNTLYEYDVSQRNKDMVGQLQILESIKRERIVLFGPSTLRYNQPLDAFKEAYPEKFIYLCGMQGSGNYKLALELVLSILSEKDYICPQLYERSLNYNTSGIYTLVYLKYDFDCLLKIDIQDYLDVIFGVLPIFVLNYSQNQNDNIFLNQRFNGYDEDGMVNYESNTDDPDNKDPSVSYSFNAYLKQEYFNYIPTLINKSKIINSHVLPCWSSYNINSVVQYDTFNEYENFAKSILNDYVFFDSIRDNIFSGDLFRKNDSIHLSMKGGTARAQKWSNKWKEHNVIS